MGELATNILVTTAIPTLLKGGVSRRQWRRTVNQIAADCFGGDKAALEEALVQTGLRGINQRPKWWVRNRLEDPALELTATRIRKSAKSLGLSDEDAKELARRWAFSRIKSPFRDHVRLANPSRFARLATLVSGEPVPVFTNPSKQLLARVGHQLVYGWAEFHNLAIAEHLYNCWAASRDHWLFLLDKGVHEQKDVHTLSYVGHQRAISRYGQAMNVAYSGLVNRESPACLWDLENNRPGGCLLAAQEMYKETKLFDAIDDLFFASAYAALANNYEVEHKEIAKRATRHLNSALHTLNNPEESLTDEFESRNLHYVLPAIRDHAVNLTK
jgi:hypothetical protein